MKNELKTDLSRPFLSGFNLNYERYLNPDNSILFFSEFFYKYEKTNYQLKGYQVGLQYRLYSGINTKITERKNYFAGLYFSGEFRFRDVYDTDEFMDLRVNKEYDTTVRYYNLITGIRIGLKFVLAEKLVIEADAGPMLRKVHYHKGYEFFVIHKWYDDFLQLFYEGIAPVASISIGFEF